jgi:hypothetical protein
MYGMFIPVLFPIALLAIFNMYVNDRLCLAYFYKKPPMYDSKLNEYALSILLYAPFLSFVLGYWALGNQQIFFNKATVRDSIHQIVDPNHSLFDFDGGNQTLMVFIILLLLILGRFVHWVSMIVIRKASENSEEDEANIDEGLGNFFDNMPGKEQKEMYATEVYNRKTLNLRSMSDESLEKLRTA